MWKRLYRSRVFYVVTLLVMLLAFFASQVRFTRTGRPMGTPDQIYRLSEIPDLNIVFILIDTLRSDRLSAYGYEDETSPVIDSLASTGLLFQNHMSQSSWTKCSMASMWTSHYPARTGVTRSEDAVSEDAMMPAEVLRDAGYHTFGLWRNAWIGPSFGFSQGFQVYHSPQAAPIAPSVRRENPTAGVAGTDQDVIESAQEFLRTHRDDRFFLYMHLMDVHQYVYDEETALFGTTYSDIYDNSIRWVDRLIGRFIGELERQGLREKTLIVIAADHGEAFGEHGHEGHARDVYSEVVTTPLIMSLPFELAEPIVVQADSENVDIWPTLFELLGLPPVEGADGHSLVPAIRAAITGQAVSEDVRYAHIDQSWGKTEVDEQPMVAVTNRPYRLVYRKAGRGARKAELYDYSADPDESQKIGVREREVRSEMMGLAEAYLDKELPEWANAPEVELDEAQLRELRALGYDVE